MLEKRSPRIVNSAEVETWFGGVECQTKMMNMAKCPNSGFALTFQVAPSLSEPDASGIRLIPE
jgi:hypothetical protein